MRLARRSEEADDLARWLAEGYASAYRTALVLLGDRADAEEAVQDAFLRAWRFRAAVPDRDGVRPWLYRVVVNACLSKLRAEGRHRRTVGLEGTGSDETWSDDAWSRGINRSIPAGPEAEAELGEQRQVLLDAVGALPEHLRVVVVLRYYAQLSEKEIAAAVHRRPGTVKSRLHEARARLGRDDRLAAVADLLPPDPTGTAVGPGRAGRGVPGTGSPAASSGRRGSQGPDRPGLGAGDRRSQEQEA